MRCPPPLPGISPNTLRAHHQRVSKPWRKVPPAIAASAASTPSMTSPPAPDGPWLLSLVASIKSASALGHLSEALAFFSLLRARSPASSLLLCPLSFIISCSSAGSTILEGQQLHALSLVLGFQDHPFLLPKLISFYTASGILSDARSVAESSRKNQYLAWNVLMSAHAAFCQWKGAIFTYKQMVDQGIVVGKYAYSSVLRACSEMRDLGLGRDIHFRMAGAGAKLDLCAWNSLVAMYAKCGALDDARKLFDGMPQRDVITWNTMISGYVSVGMGYEASELLRLMPVNTVIWNAIVTENLQLGNYKEALRLIYQMGVNGPDVNHVTLLIGLKACSKMESLKIGKEIHGAAIRVHCAELENIVNALITMYCRCKHTGYAYTLFRIVETRTLITWNAMIAGVAYAEKVEETYLHFHEMIGSGIQPNHVTVITMLSLCTRTMSLEHGRQLHCYSTKHGLEEHLPLLNSLIAIYSKLGRMAVAKRVFTMMESHDVISYTLLIAGYGMQGKGITSLSLFQHMISSGIKPDHVTMVAVLSACSHSGLVNEGMQQFVEMIAEHGIAPRLEHFSCIVDLCCRAGLVVKAEEVINQMPLEPSIAMLATLVIASRVHGYKEIEVRAANKLMKMKSANSTATRGRRQDASSGFLTTANQG